MGSRRRRNGRINQGGKSFIRDRPAGDALISVPRRVTAPGGVDDWGRMQMLVTPLPIEVAAVVEPEPHFRDIRTIYY